MTNSERTPLVNTQATSGGSVVSYTIPQQTNCANVTLKDRSTAKSTKRKLWFAVVLACLFFATELVAGYFANSLGKNFLCYINFFFLLNFIYSLNVGRFSFIIRRCEFYRRTCSHLFG